TFDSNIAYAFLQPDANRAPVAHDENFDDLPHDQIGHPVVIGKLLDLASDPDGDPVQIASINGPGNGTLKADANGVYTYYPDANTIEDSIQVTYTDGYDTSVAAIHISWVEHAPTVEDITVHVNFATSISNPHLTLSWQAYGPLKESAWPSTLSLFNVTDSSGNPIIQDGDNTPGQPPVDR